MKVGIATLPPTIVYATSIEVVRRRTMGDSPVPKLSILWRVKNSIFEARDGQQNKWVSMVSQWFMFSSFP